MTSKLSQKYLAEDSMTPEQREWFDKKQVEFGLSEDLSMAPEEKKCFDEILEEMKGANTMTALKLFLDTAVSLCINSTRETMTPVGLVKRAENSPRKTENMMTNNQRIAKEIFGRDIWDYYDLDINACYLMEDKIKEKGWENLYIEELEYVTGASGDMGTYDDRWRVVHATPQQRVEAAIRMLDERRGK